MRELVALAPNECELLLRGGGIGRLAVSTPEGPSIVPVSYSIVDGTMVFAIPSSGLLAKVADGASLAFEVDSVDSRQQIGWSVVVRGRGAIVTEAEVLQRITSPPWPPRAAGDKDTYIRLPLGEISGRRLLAHSGAERAQ